MTDADGVAPGTDIVQFLLAQIEQDEATVKAWREAAQVPVMHPRGECDHCDATRQAEVIVAAGLDARLLAECRTKWQIIDEHHGRDGRCRVCAAHHDGNWRRFRTPCWTLRFAAAVYTDRPGYNPAWSVDL